jgi:membrane protease YdiL (CAAX protease family)
MQWTRQAGHMGTAAKSANLETSALAPFASQRYAAVAGPVHTIFALLILGAWAFVGRMNLATGPHRIRLYVLTFFVEWLVFAYVVAGVRRSSGSIASVLGNPWHSVRQVLRDSGIAAAFWVISIILLVIFGWFLRVASQGRDIRFLLPHGSLELALWITVSLTAGVCEETIFRGYLQSQFMALTNSAPAGVLLSAAAFGAVHAYQGSRRMILITLHGVLFGILARWRGSVRPGMIAHAWHDSLSGLLAILVKTRPA